MTTEVVSAIAPFTAARFQSPTLHGLLGNLAELEVVVDEAGTIRIRGVGFREEVALAFTRSVFDWEAEVIPSVAVPGLSAGTYYLAREGDVDAIVVLTEKGPVAWVDGPAEVVLRRVFEED